MDTKQPLTFRTSDSTAAGAIPRRAVVRNERLSSSALAEAYLVWRCYRCGETGDLEAFPVACSNCDAPREDLYYWTED
ncbi:hypothetical protein AUR64_15730 [Haloprofundus marisrubri]|uniref:DUF7130 domain-containing protein n=1 Tax=Haloprofundus marisrubri TaxID=1514971 RepID=A0A0W1R824_9EURY|nr:hypothetical protein [Haloprofundus marisrubri]KTG09239.1 hypothetical protein AUR64_15730 [Haloprofundus marisrubri]